MALIQSGLLATVASLIVYGAVTLIFYINPVDVAVSNFISVIRLEDFFIQIG